MGTIQQDTTIEGDVTCNNCTVRGSLTVGGIPLSIGVNVEEEGVPLAGNPHQILNLIGPGTTAVDAGGGQANITIAPPIIENEGVALAGAPHQTVNYVGPSVTAADAGAGVATITVIPPVLENEGVAVAGAPHQTIDFVGGGVDVSDAGGGTATVDIPGITFTNGGVPIAGAPHVTLDAGDGIVFSDAGAGVATITGGIAVDLVGVPIAANPKDTLNFTGNGVDATDAPPDTATITIPRNAVLSWGALDVGAAADSRFLAPGFIAAAPLTDSMQVPCPFVGNTTLRCLHVRHNLAIGDGDPVDYTVFVNGIATGITVSLATGAVGQAADLVNTAAIVQGDRVSIQATKALAITDGNISAIASLVFD